MIVTGGEITAMIAGTLWIGLVIGWCVGVAVTKHKEGGE